MATEVNLDPKNVQIDAQGKVVINDAALASEIKKLLDTRGAADKPVRDFINFNWKCNTI